MQNRREFMQAGSLGLLGLFASRSFAETTTLLTTNQSIKKTTGWRHIRNHFDLESKLVYLNNGTMGPSPKVVTKKIIDRMKVVDGKGIYGGGDYECTKALARLTKTTPEEIALTHNVTEGINLAAWGLPLIPGDEIILSTHEHVGNAGAWLNLSRLKNVVIKVVPFGASAEETLQIVTSSITKKTRVIAIPHIPCTTGQVAPIQEICAVARSKGIYTVIDGAHGTGMLNLDLHKMGCDVYASCCHKWLLGPKGSGYLFVRKDFQKELESIVSGAYSIQDWEISEQKTSIKGLVDNAHKYYAGTQCSANYFGVVAAVEFHESFGLDTIEYRVRELNNQLYEGLEKIDNIQILTPKESISRCAVLSFRFKNFDNQTFYREAAKQDVMLRYVAESNLDCIRISTHLYNSEKEVDQVLAMVRSKA